MFLDTVETFRSQRGGRLSFTDAAVVTVARKRDARFVATFDQDFRQVDLPFGARTAAGRLLNCAPELLLLVSLALATA